jgi:hypothetical protein
MADQLSHTKPEPDFQPTHSFSLKDESDRLVKLIKTLKEELGAGNPTNKNELSKVFDIIEKTMTAYAAKDHSDPRVHIASYGFSTQRLQAVAGAFRDGKLPWAPDRFLLPDEIKTVTGYVKLVTDKEKDVILKLVTVIYRDVISQR